MKRPDDNRAQASRSETDQRKEKKDDVDEEEDYMSNEFLNQIADTRPGLVFNRATARKYELEKKHHEKSQTNREVSRRELEETQRTRALQTSTLTEDNKGFNLMLKMGYKKGEALGKQTAGISASTSTSTSTTGMDETSEKSSSGGDGLGEEPRVKMMKRCLVEPIPIVVKSDRVGLGRESENEQRLAEYRRHRLQLELNEKATYLDKKRSSFQLRKLLHSFHKCQRVCFHLDTTRHNLKKPKFKWYWPRSIVKSLRQQEEQHHRMETSSEPSTASARDDDDDDEQRKAAEFDKQPGLTSEPPTSLSSRSVIALMSGELVGNNSTSDVDLAQVYQQRLDDFLRPTKTSSTTSSSVVKRNEDNQEEEEDEEEEEEDDELELKSRRNELKRREEIDKNENETEALSEREENEEEEEEEEEEGDDDDDEGEIQNEELLQTRTDEICVYLRCNYAYCVWCGSSAYANERELDAACPGLRQRDHDDYDE